MLASLRPMSGAFARLGGVSGRRLSAVAVTKAAAVPTYPRKISEYPNICVHLGVGGFHRSHQQVSFRNLQFGITRNVARTNRALARSIGRDAPNEPDIRRTGPHAKRL